MCHPAPGCRPRASQQAPAAKAVFIAPSRTGAIALLGTASASSRTGAQVVRGDIFQQKCFSCFYQVSWYQQTKLASLFQNEACRLRGEEEHLQYGIDPF